MTKNLPALRGDVFPLDGNAIESLIVMMDRMKTQAFVVSIMICFTRFYYIANAKLKTLIER